MTRLRRTCLAGVSIALTAPLAVLHHRHHPETIERFALHGTWSIIFRTVAGRPVPVPPDAVVVIDGAAMTFSIHRAGSPEAPVPFRLNARTMPKQMDIHSNRGRRAASANGWDGVTRAVYELAGESLVLSWYANETTKPDPNQRPSDFPWRVNEYTSQMVLTKDR